MVYVGGKARYAKDILRVVLAGSDRSRPYVEPFAGGFNTITRVTGPRWANDNHRYLIAMFQALQAGWVPPRIISEEFYIDVRDNRDRYSDPVVGWVGFAATYSGKWFGGYARGKAANGTPRDYVGERFRNIMKQVPALAGMRITHGDYSSMAIQPGSLVYCDPPYANSQGYAGAGAFDSTAFYAWAEDLVRAGSVVYVSEYSAPDHWIDAWSRRVHSTLDQDTGSKQETERLYRVVVA